MLNAYLTQTARLLQNPAASTSLYTNTDLTSYINTARWQLAVESECIRTTGTLPTAAATQVYGFSTITLPASQGYNSVLSVRLASILSGSARTMLDQRPFEWFWAYYLAGGSAQPAGDPTLWAQQGQGENGTLYFYPIPSGIFSINLDVAVTPINLASDGDPEAIPYPWTDAVPFFAAYYAFMSAQRQEDADRMFARFETFVRRARQGSTATVLPGNYPGGAGTNLAAAKTTLTGQQGGR